MSTDIRHTPCSTRTLTAAVLGSMDLWSVIGVYLTPRDCCRSMSVCRLVRDTVKFNSLIWRAHYNARWGASRTDGLVSPSKHPDWLKAFERLQVLSRAALTGRWFEYDGCFAQATSTYRFSLALHCSEALAPPEPVPPEPLTEEDQAMLRQEEEFRARYNKDPSEHAQFAPYVPFGNILIEGAAHVPYPDSLRPVFPRGLRPGHYCAPPQFPPVVFTHLSLEAALAVQLDAYSVFVPTVVPSELLTIKRNHLGSARDPSVGGSGGIPVQGVITWTRETSSTDMFDTSAMKTNTAQEFVGGIYVKEDRMLYLAGAGRDMVALDAFLGIDLYRLQLSPDGHSFSGCTLGNVDEDGAWNNPMRGGTRLFRENIINLMRDEVSQLQSR